MQLGVFRGLTRGGGGGEVGLTTLFLINPNTFVGLVGKVRKNYLPKEEGREGGGKKRAQRAHRTQGSNPGPAAC